MTIAKRPSSASRVARKCASDLPDGATDQSATNWHDGQLAHAGHARIARRADDQSADRTSRQHCFGSHPHQHAEGVFIVDVQDRPECQNLMVRSAVLRSLPRAIGNKSSASHLARSAATVLGESCTACIQIAARSMHCYRNLLLSRSDALRRKGLTSMRIR